MSKKLTDDQKPKRKMLGHWRSPQRQQAYEESYAEAMKRLPPPSKTLDVPTDYGTYIHHAQQGRDLFDYDVVRLGYAPGILITAEINVIMYTPRRAQQSQY